MTSISATAGQSYSAARSVLQSELVSRVSSASDQKALSSAVDDIESALESVGGLGASGSSPSAMKSKVEGLIDGQVESGKLDAAQAAELKEVFNSVAAGAGAANGSDGGTSSLTSDSSIDEIFKEFVSSLQQSQTSSGYNSTGVRSSACRQVVDYKA